MFKSSVSVRPGTETQATGDNDFECWINGSENGDGSLTVHDRHGYIHQHHGNLIPVLLVNNQRFLTVDGGQNTVARALQYEFRDFADGLLVFRHQHQLVMPVYDRYVLWQTRQPCWLLYRGANRQIHLERAASARLAVTSDKSAVTFDNGQTRGQPQTGAFARPLGGEERLKDSVLNFLWHPGASVRHLDDHILAGAGVHVFSCIQFIQFHVLNPDGQFAAFGHGVTGIDAQV